MDKDFVVLGYLEAPSGWKYIRVGMPFNETSLIPFNKWAIITYKFNANVSALFGGLLPFMGGMPQAMTPCDINGHPVFDVFEVMYPGDTWQAFENRNIGRLVKK